LVLGGVVIPFNKGLDGHSDGDTLLHAIIDALLGAAVIGDIGTNFPSDVPEYLGIASNILLEKTIALLLEAGWQPIHIDATIIAQQPLMSPYIQLMRQMISKSIGVHIDAISIKATTTDGLGSIGQGEGIATIAIATIESKI